MEGNKFILQHPEYEPYNAEFDESKSHPDIVFSEKNRVAKKNVSDS
jgi:hypothetical protein